MRLYIGSNSSWIEIDSNQVGINSVGTKMNLLSLVADITSLVKTFKSMRINDTN